VLFSYQWSENSSAPWQQRRFKNIYCIEERRHISNILNHGYSSVAILDIARNYSYEEISDKCG